MKIDKRKAKRYFLSIVPSEMVNEGIIVPICSLRYFSSGRYVRLCATYDKENNDKEESKRVLFSDIKNNKPFEDYMSRKAVKEFDENGNIISEKLVDGYLFYFECTTKGVLTGTTYLVRKVPAKYRNAWTETPSRKLVNTLSKKYSVRELFLRNNVNEIEDETSWIKPVIPQRDEMHAIAVRKNQNRSLEGYAHLTVRQNAERYRVNHASRMTIRRYNRNRKIKTYLYKNEQLTIRQISEMENIDIALLGIYVYKGLSVEEAVQKCIIHREKKG